MNARERVLAAVAGQPVDRTPAGFWLHFPPAMHNGEAAVQAHLDFFAQTGTDIMKVMTENLVPHDIPLQTPADWKALKPFRRTDKFITSQVEILKRVLDKVGGKGVVLATIHGVTASAWHARGGPEGYETGSAFLSTHLRENPAAVSYGFSVIAEAVALLTEECLKAGVDGIYYAALGGERYLFTDEEFETYIKPNDLKILEAAKNPPAFNILHVCKDKLNLSRYAGYPCHVVNWGVYEQNPSLEEGKKLFPGKVLLGGLDDRAGVLVDGPPEAIENEVFSILTRMGTTGFLLGADCTLPTEIPYSHIRTAVEATGKFAAQ